MTTRIQVNADSGKPLRVRGVNPLDPEAGTALDRVVMPGTSDNFYVHASMALMIEEVQPTPEPGTEAVDAAAG